MPMYDSKPGSKRYYIIERCGVPLTVRFLHTIGKIPVPGDGQALSKQPTWHEAKYAFRFDTYTAACHWLARWRPDGTHRLVYVDEDTDDFKYVMDGPAEPERFDERDWKEFHHMNGKSL